MPLFFFRTTFILALYFVFGIYIVSIICGMKEKEFFHTYEYEWDKVACAFWGKYCFKNCFYLFIGHPKCSHSKAIVLDRFIDKDGRLVTKRLHIIYQKIPYYIQMISGRVVTYGGEESIVDPYKKEIHIVTKNLSFTNQASVVDISSIQVNPLDPNKTDYLKTTTVSGNVCFISDQIERWYIGNERKHFKNGIWVINDILKGKFHINTSTNIDEEGSEDM